MITTSKIIIGNSTKWVRELKEREVAFTKDIQEREKIDKECRREGGRSNKKYNRVHLLPYSPWVDLFVHSTSQQQFYDLKKIFYFIISRMNSEFFSP